MENNKKNSGVIIFTSIRTRIVAMSVGCIVAALIIAFFSIIPSASDALSDSGENNMLDLAKSYIKILNNNINAINETVTYMESEPDVYNGVQSPEGSYLVQAELKKYMRKNSAYTGVAVYNKTGALVATSGDGAIASEDTPYYVNAVLSTGKAAQSDILADGVGEPSVVCAVPLSNSGNMYGVVCVTVAADIITSELAEIKLQGIESSFAYLISPQGYFIYHPEKDIVGKITGNALIRGFLEQRNVASAIGRFYFDGSEKVIGLATSATNNWMLVIQANESELLEPINSMMIKTIIILVVTLVVLAVLVYIISRTITNPIKSLTKAIDKISRLNFKENKKLAELSKRSDETGAMSRVVESMVDNFRDIVVKINAAAQNIGDGSEKLNNIATSLNDCASDNSAVSEELAAGMEQTSTMTGSIYNEVENIKMQTESMIRKSQDTLRLSNEILVRADNSKEFTSNASDGTRKLYDEVRQEAKVALEQSNAVNKINELTKDIMNIADQTSLLALNASIEAARSGEHGKGFAVVANEIGNLANQSAETVAGIESIVTEVTEAVDSIDKCLDKVLTFMEKSVLGDYDEFMKVSEQYNKDAKSFGDTIQDVCVTIDKLGDATAQIADAISKINITITDASEGINGIAERATDVVSLSSDTYSKVQDNTSLAGMLKEIVDKFTLE